MPPAEPIRFRSNLGGADPGRIRALVAATGVFSDEEVRTAGELADTTLSGAETYRWLLAERDGRLLGYTCFDRVPLTSVSFDLYWIAVAPEARGSGLAAELMRLTADLARRRGALAIYAETSSREPYAAARAFYRKAGFIEAARFADFYERGDDKVVYRLAL
jgi:ribosomal protein S18 acetylase RimI-like enzyme